jgi:hypothetical protein
MTRNLVSLLKPGVKPGFFMGAVHDLGRFEGEVVYNLRLALRRVRKRGI